MGRPGSSAARVRRPLTAAPPSRIGEGLGLLDRALRRQRPGPYQLQAAIAAQHALAARAADTDWLQIAAPVRRAAATAALADL
jgi:predicted RNA polymerase sigma factor